MFYDTGSDETGEEVRCVFLMVDMHINSIEQTLAGSGPALMGRAKLSPRPRMWVWVLVRLWTSSW